MPTLPELEAAFVKADAAGNAEDAAVFATEIKRLRRDTEKKNSIGGRPEMTTPGKGRDAGGALADIALEAGPAIVGGIIAGPPGAVAGGLLGNIGAQSRRILADEQPPEFKIGQMGTSALLAGVPGAKQVGTGIGLLAKEGAKHAAAGLTAKTAETLVDEGRLPTGTEALLSTVLPGVGGAVGQKLGGKADDFLNPTERATLEAAKDQGLKVIPSHASDSFLNKRLESLGGKAAVKQAIQAENIESITAAAKKALGIPERTQLSEEALEAIRKQEGGPYGEIAAMAEAAKSKLDEIRRTTSSSHDLEIQLGQNQDAIVQAGADINKLREARKTARKEYAHYDRQQDPKALDRAEAAYKLAESLEDRIEEAAKLFGSPDLLDRLKAARTRIAKTWDVENALVAGNNEVSANMLLRALKKDRPLSGELKDIANFKSAFSESVGEPGRIPTAGVSALEPMAAGAAILAGKPMAAGLPLLRYPARSVLLSDWYQKMQTAKPFDMPTAAAATRVASQEAGQEVTRVLTPAEAKKAPPGPFKGSTTGKLYEKLPNGKIETR